MDANPRRQTMLRTELADVLPREKPAGWPPGISWEMRWDALAEHIHQNTPILLLARRYDMTEDRMRRWLSQTRNMAHGLGVIP